MKGHKQNRGPATWRLFAPYKDPTTSKWRQRTRTFHGTERQADTALARFVTEVAAGQLGEHDKVTVEQLLERWLAYRTFVPSTVRGHRSKIRLHILPVMGSTPVVKVTALQCDELYRSMRSKGLAPASIQQVHRILHAAFEQARRWTWVPSNLVTDASPPPEELVEPEDLDPALVAKAVAAADGRLGIAARLAAATGARCGELCGVQWRDFDRAARTLRFQRRAVYIPGEAIIIRPLTKNKTRRAIALDRRTVAMLRLLHYDQRRRARACGVELAGTAFVLSEAADGAVLSPNTLSHRWNRHRTALGIPLKLHELRHWHASILDDAGVQTSRRAKRLGHARESTTQKFYTHVLRTDDHDLAAIVAGELDRHRD